VVADHQGGPAGGPDPRQRGKQRSVHNTYFTLPVLFAMLSNHYSFTYSHPQNWLVLILMMLAGAAIRQFFVMRHGYKLGATAPLALCAGGRGGDCGRDRLAQAERRRLQPVATNSVAKRRIHGAGGQIAIRKCKVLEQRCYLCHGAQVQMKNVRLDSPEGVKQHAQAVYQQWW
jgi:uncharacterized membrane protein